MKIKRLKKIILTLSFFSSFSVACQANNNKTAVLRLKAYKKHQTSFSLMKKHMGVFFHSHFKILFAIFSVYCIKQHYHDKNSATDRIPLRTPEREDVNIRTKHGHTPLHHAAWEGSIELVNLLIKAGADVNTQDEEGDTPLHWAARNNSVEVAQLLLKAGADKEIMDKEGGTPLHWAAWSSSVEVAQLLLKAGASTDAHMKDEEKISPLHIAAYKNSVEVAQLLLKAGASKDAKDKHGHTPLEVAKRRGHTKVATYLKQTA